MSTRILVTGGNGYIGSILIPELMKKHFHVTVLDTFSNNQSNFANLCIDKQFEVVKGDCRDLTTLKPLLKDCDYIIPLAALVGAPLCNADKIGATSTNYDAIKLLVDNCSNQQRILLPTTNSGYGAGKAEKIYTEESELNPISLYGVTKMKAESIVLERDVGLSFRLATVFGMSTSMRIDLLVNDFTYRAVNDKAVTLFESHFKRNYIHIRDVSRVFLHAIDNYDKMKGQSYNVGLSDANLSKWELCEKIKKHIPTFVFSEAEIGEDPDKRNYLVSNEKIEKSGFKPQHTIDDGILELIKGYQMINNSKFSNI